jgi:hypothetical protein
MSSKLEKLYQECLNIEPILPGTIRGQYSVCGNQNCRCADKENPIKHGPQSKLSFSLAGKSSTIFIRKADVTIAQQMTDNFARLSQLQTAILEESVSLYREKGATLANKEILTDIAHAKSKVFKGRKDTRQVDEQEDRVNNWKTKATDRAAELRKITAQLKSLTAGRDKWKKEAIALRKETNIQEIEVQKFQNICTEQEKQILSLEEEFKKSRN